ncbi:hypothetical protein FSOLCH5_000236 [Fusarium solani]
MDKVPPSETTMAEPTRSGRPCAQRQLAASKSTANLATSSGEILEWVKGYGHSPSKTAVRGTQYPSAYPWTNQRLLTPHIWHDSRESGVDKLQVVQFRRDSTNR